MNYNEAIEFIHAIPRFVRPLGNEKLAKLLERLGDPQKELKFVHVAGTNGKGSVCAMLAETLRRAGYKTGLFTSPFIEVFNERIQINNELIPDKALAEYVTEAAELMGKDIVSEFAFITAVAMKYFADEHCDIVVLETGMGGRLDATNVIDAPEVAVLTRIGMDHTQYLGNTIEEIAAEKCGIIKRGCEIVSVPNERVRSVIVTEFERNGGGRLTFCDKPVPMKGKFGYKTWTYHIALGGTYQAENGAAVIETVNALRRRGWEISGTALDEGFRNVKHPARYERVADNIIIDGAHNLDAMRELKTSLATEERDIVLVLAMMRDKSYDICIHTIASAASCIIATELKMDRALTAAEIKRVADNTETECVAEPDIKKAIKTAVGVAGKHGLVCVCGSLYLAGEARRIINEAAQMCGR
ncbi:MAG: bifunctional folylpolyglutamate synthase/dihydrofolate synthase [Clostridia bacterium]|nr:bifunctional folylpolyglutamate synthase/dihydrofolate synthase [Clostridia bacterium]